MSAGQKFKCEVCGKEFKAITNSHLKKHRMTTEDYKKRYPDSCFGDFSRFSAWRKSDENKENCQKMTDKVYKSSKIRSQKAVACRRSTQSKDYRKRQSDLMKQKISENPEKWPQLKSTKPTDWMKKSNYERWVIKYGIEEADKRQKNWHSKNIIPSCSKDTIPELEFASILRELDIKYETQKAIRRYVCDFYLPDYNVVVEIDGDYWHANPAKYSPDSLIGGKKMIAKEIWEKDSMKTKEISKSGFGILRYWASDLKNTSHNKIFEDIVHTSMKIED